MKKNKPEKKQIDAMVQRLMKQEILALPTESVYGLSAIIARKPVQKITELKQRDLSKGFIVLSGSVKHLLELIDSQRLTIEQLDKLQTIQEVPTTWVVPVKSDYQWLTGAFDTIAVRLTTHSLLCTITQQLGQAIISTSANLSSQPPAVSVESVQAYFGEQLDYIYDESHFKPALPSRIINLMTGEVLRK